MLRGFREKVDMTVAGDSTKAVQGRESVYIREEKGNEKIRGSVGQSGRGDTALETQGTGVQLSRDFSTLSVLGSANSC